MFYVGHDSYAKLWKIEEKKKKNGDGTIWVGRISTSETDQNGEKRYSNWNATFVGNAKEMAPSLKDGDYIIIKRCKITNTSFKNKNGETDSWLDVTIFELELNNRDKRSSNQENDEDAESKSSKTNKSKSKPSSKSKKNDEEITDDDLPF